jgi:hypothetical protein
VETLKVVTPLLIIAAQTAAKTSVVRLPQNTQFLGLSYAFRRTKTVDGRRNGLLEKTECWR